jgi:hypothetical protein
VLFVELASLESGTDRPDRSYITGCTVCSSQNPRVWAQTDLKCFEKTLMVPSKMLFELLRRAAEKFLKYVRQALIKKFFARERILPASCWILQRDGTVAPLRVASQRNGTQWNQAYVRLKSGACRFQCSSRPQPIADLFLRCPLPGRRRCTIARVTGGPHPR